MVTPRKRCKHCNKPKSPSSDKGYCEDCHSIILKRLIRAVKRGEVEMKILVDHLPVVKPNMWFRPEGYGFNYEGLGKPKTWHKITPYGGVDELRGI